MTGFFGGGGRIHFSLFRSSLLLFNLQFFFFLIQIYIKSMSVQYFVILLSPSYFSVVVSIILGAPSLVRLSQEGSSTFSRYYFFLSLSVNKNKKKRNCKYYAGILLDHKLSDVF